MPLEYHALTDVGRHRGSNEDSYQAQPELGLFAVADGMGGQAAGEVASRIAIDTLTLFIKRSAEEQDITWPNWDDSFTRNQNRLRAAFSFGNKEIYEHSLEETGRRGMGTTMVCALIEGDHMDLAHVGDSRAYLLRGGELQLLTRDHSWISEQVSQGLITEEQARFHPYRNVVTRALGASPQVEVELSELQLQNGDLILICSDGLNSMLPDGAINDLLWRYSQDLESATNALVHEANRMGGLDNITVVLLRFTAA